MARKGETKSEKRLASSKARMIERKKFKFTIKCSAGAHPAERSVPLGYILRELLELARNLGEAKKILNEGKIKVDRIVRRNYKFPIGLFDTISIEEAKKNYRIVFDHKGRIVLKEINPKEATTKLCKVLGKKISKGKLVQLGTHDGRSILLKECKLKRGDSVKLELPSQKILENIELKKGAIAYLIGGKHIGKTAKIKEISEGTSRRSRLITLEEEKHDFQTLEENVMVIGEKKPEMDL